MTKKIDVDLRTEKAMREACKLLLAGKASRSFGGKGCEVEVYRSPTGAAAVWEKIAIFDLRDCYRKRAPLTGITKRIRKAIQPRRKR